MDKLVENYFFTQINIYMPIWIRPMHALTNIMFNSHTTVHKCIVNGLEYSIQSDTVVIYTSVGDVVAVYPISTWTRVQLFQCSCKYWHRFFLLCSAKYYLSNSLSMNFSICRILHVLIVLFNCFIPAITKRPNNIPTRSKYSGSVPVIQYPIFQVLLTWEKLRHQSLWQYKYQDTD